MLGGDELIQPFRNKLANDIDAKYKSFKQANVEKENGFKVSTLSFASSMHIIITDHS